MEPWFILGILGYLFYAISTSIDAYLMDRKYEIMKTNTFKMLFDGFILFIMGLVFFRLSFTTELFLWSLVAGFLYALSGIIYFKALSLGDVNEVVPFLLSFPILLIFVGSLVFFREKANFFNYAGIFFILLGVYSVLSENGLKIPKVNKVFFLILIGVFLEVVYSLFIKSLLFNIKPIDLAIMMYFSAALILFVYQILFKKQFLNHIINFKSKIPNILIASFFGAVGTLLIYSALALGNASKVYPIAGLNFIFVFFIASFFLKKKFYWHRLIGAIIVFIGIYLISL